MPHDTRHPLSRLGKYLLSDVSNVAFFTAFLIALFFSYQPALVFGMNAGINLKLGLPIVFGIVFVIKTLPVIIFRRGELFKNIGVRLFLGFATVNTLSIVWSANKSRAVFETGLIWLLFAIFVAVIALFPRLYTARRRLITVAYVMTIVVCAFASWQVIGDALGVSPAFTLLSAPYQATLFGFARPTGFALEPQFLASLLIIPVTLAVRDILRGRASALALAVAVLVTATIIVTISRGGLLAVGISLILTIIAVRGTTVRYLRLAAVFIVGAGAGLVLIATAATIDTRDSITAGSAVTGTVRHVTLGKVDLKDLLVPPDPAPAPATMTPSNPTATPAPAQQPVSIPVYVAESTESRLQMSDEAVKLWLSSPVRFFFGIGVGAFGAVIHAAHSEYALNSIVNNEYLQVASELGMVGLILFGALLLVPLVGLARRRQWVMAACLVALYSQWLYFSGNINVFHLWVFVALAYGVRTLAPRRSSKLSTPPQTRS